MSAHASAPSVPGRTHTRRSACFAVACRYTSMHTIFAPRSRRARRAWVITFTWVLAALVPQMITRSDFAISRGSAPARRPVPAMNPFHARVVQMVECWPGVAHGVAEAVDPVALHETHGARVVVGPDRLRTVALGCPLKGSRPLRRGPRPTRWARTCRARCAGAAGSTGPGDGPAPRSAPPCCRPPRRCSRSPPPRAPGRSATGRGARSRARRWRGSRGGRRCSGSRVQAPRS